MEKIFNPKSFNYFVWIPCSHYLPLVLLTPAVNLPPVSLTPVANFPTVSTTLAKLVAKFAAGVIDTGGKFAPVSLLPVVHLDLRISPRIFEKIQNGLNGILWGWGELIHEKTKSKNLMTLSL